MFIPPKTKGSPTRVCEASQNAHCGLLPTLGEGYGPLPRMAMPNWRTDLQGFFFLGPVILGHLSVRGSIENCSLFLSIMASPSHSVNFPQEASSPAFLALVLQMGGL